ncbi:MAG: GIY-YIG nuclease family protein [Proteobacteria bacterium]|nr:GIY-YIG nuclease family protein [Pseudomonadota bacterium]MBI3496730.1 GIY-YIG nuclease family protein [Pseudomonadota bacterium]
MTVFVYILRCSDGHYYVGSTRRSLEERLAEHNRGTYDGYTKSRRPVTLVFHQSFDDPLEAVSAERRLKGWRRAKKEALMRGDFEALRMLAASRSCGGSSFDKLRTSRTHAEGIAVAKEPKRGRDQ